MPIAWSLTPMPPNPPDAIHTWADTIGTALADAGGPLVRSRVLAETDSTQVAARRLASIGEVIVTGRQTAGKGRRGRAWADTGDAGVAMTCTIAADRNERLAVAAAVAVAIGLEALAAPGAGSIGIKWPNDVLINRRKVAGVLIEQVDPTGPKRPDAARRALVGIGINVSQRTWPDELANRAISLHQAGVDVERIDVIVAVLVALNAALGWSDQQLCDAFARRDALAGATVTAVDGSATVEGTVRAVDPMRGITLATRDGETRLNAPTTHITTVTWPPQSQQNAPDDRYTDHDHDGGDDCAPASNDIRPRT